MIMDFNSTKTYLSLLDELISSTNITQVKSKLEDFVSVIYQTDLEDKYSKPMYWIGMYIALASLYCILAITADLIHGLRNRELWFPFKFFTINAFSLTVIAVAMKLPVDLSSPMPGEVDRAAKLGSVAFMCTMMANLLPCLATMDDNALLANITALVVLVITLVVNVCIQIQTGVVMSCGLDTLYNIKRLVFGSCDSDVVIVLIFGIYPSYNTIATIYVTMLLVLLIIYVSSSLAILKSKQIIESKYQQGHERASVYLQQPTEQLLLSTEKLQQHVSNYWIMARSSSPQFIIACSATTTASGVICVLSTILYILTMGWKVSVLDDHRSDYKQSMPVIFTVQCIGVILGTAAPVSRCFASLSFKLSIKSIPKVVKVESYWTQKLYEWKDGSIPFMFRSHKRKVLIKSLRSLILNLCIKLQEGVVVLCKIIALIPFFCIICCLYCFCSSGKKTDNLEGRPYVLQLDELELADRTLEGHLNSLNRLIQKSEKNQPKTLMNLISKKCTIEFQGVKMLNNNDYWSLAVVTLATIVVTLHEIKKVEVDSLLKSVREGLEYVTLVEKNLNASNDDYVGTQKAAERLWQEVDVCNKWLGISLKDIASQVITMTCQEDTTLQIVRLFSEQANKKIQGVGSTHGDSEFTYICANMMSRITETIIDDHKESHNKSFDELISSRIADIMAACLTNLPKVIAMKCHTSVIEKREASVQAMAKVLGEIKEIIKTLQGLSRHDSSVNPDDLPVTEP